MQNDSKHNSVVYCVSQKEFFIYLESYFGLIQVLFQNSLSSFLNGLVNENVQGCKAHRVRYISRVTACAFKRRIEKKSACWF